MVSLEDVVDALEHVGQLLEDGETGPAQDSPSLATTGRRHSYAAGEGVCDARDLSAAPRLAEELRQYR